MVITDNKTIDRRKILKSFIVLPFVDTILPFIKPSKPHGTWINLYNFQGEYTGRILFTIDEVTGVTNDISSTLPKGDDNG